MEIYDIETLQKAFQQKKKLKYVFFWGHTPSRMGVVDKAVFSQWYVAHFEVDSVIYPTAEHFMMAEKARLFGAKDIEKEILMATSPAKAKDLGRKIVNFDEKIWQQHRFEIVYRGNLAKFSQNTDLQAFLLATNQRILVEASPVDKIWGIGLEQNNPQVENPLLWKGLNLLGFALMKVRDDLLKTFV
ncbi:MAG: NADAR family protein [Capnocytophaga sp.]|nr:NADAR family protein [Capnocytophaga sp.]